MTKPPNTAGGQQKDASTPPLRRPYTTPVLTEYGSIGKLTRAGSGGVGEGVGGMTMVMCL